MSHRKLLSSALVEGKLKVELSKFREYYQAIENKFQSDKKSIEDMKDSSIYDDMNEFERDYYNIELHHLDIHRKSCLVTLYSYLESFLNYFCEYLYELNGRKLKYTDLSGTGIFRARLYLLKVEGVDFDQINNRWNQIKGFNLIRNNIVHESGKVGKDKLIKFIETNENLSINNFDDVRIESGYIHELIDIIESFILNIHTQVFIE
ncbi:hypothetical protein [Psychrobacter sp. UBA6291]|uniref:hypothetical protein n=1 Tax=Psychrobacter sp. UBA6291 TaxID=1947357 RepID=UPI002579E2CF|nr:hypothetical protein [Psychrobacter sp. UBA6291]